MNDIAFIAREIKKKVAAGGFLKQHGYYPDNLVSGLKAYDIFITNIFVGGYYVSLIYRRC